jgi:hypothetical protein
VKRALRAGCALLALAVVGAAVWLVPGLGVQIRVGEGYVAKQVCSCMFVAGRDFAACRADVPASMDPIQAEALADGVRAWVTLFGERRAHYVPDRGCTLDVE